MRTVEQRDARDDRWSRATSPPFRTIETEIERDTPAGSTVVAAYPEQERDWTRIEPASPNDDNDRVPASLPLDKPRIKEVAGTIVRLDPEHLTVNCYLPDRELEIQLPISLVPEELRRYGVAVSISMDRSSSYRKLQVSSRNVQDPITSKEVEESRNWSPD